ncbi:MAG: hypothetical protein JST66_15985, partial [Bacteroidetes bacterium]|nr:hypothetical protein [Bacteroidota bacterium]
MRLLLLPLLLVVASCFGQSDSWTRKNDVAYNGVDGPRIGDEATAFAIGDTGYVMDRSGRLWAYDPTGNTWAARSLCPGGPAGALAVEFSIGGKGYVCVTSGTAVTWEFDPVAGSWTAKASFPGPTRSAAFGFAINGKGYVTGGLGTPTYKKDLWSFDPVANAWTQL